MDELQITIPSFTSATHPFKFLSAFPPFPSSRLNKTDLLFALGFFAAAMDDDMAHFAVGNMMKTACAVTQIQAAR
jgi:hypothetical protein